ncbi:hypothetical protein DOTSEDRAFT_19260 [Dothistroma septosporum NZE10]|uniref:Uncharacterized protein n=1 Tax=Dothistroma septosporum (strain NZE10 / CBS 128990) TaxID=675120 RepID=N1Q2Q2_DOTSN|nr:hypothetical protein DOTSEDRAFT_19260 [Dothistroma septosporum NZE10]
MAGAQAKLRRVLSRATLKKSKFAATVKPVSTTLPTPTSSEVQSIIPSDTTANTSEIITCANGDPIAASLRRSARTRADSIKTLFRTKSAVSLAPSDIPSTVDSDEPDPTTAGETTNTASTQASRQDGVSSHDYVKHGEVRQHRCTQDATNAFALDGAQEEPESKEKTQQRAQEGPQTGSGGRKAASSLSVADRVLGFERRGTLGALPKPVKRHRHSKAVYDEDAAEDSPDKSKEPLPIVFPLHVRKFQRRDSKAATMIQKPETPLYRSEPDHDPTIHSPAPQRPIPALKTPPGTPPPTEPAVSAAKTLLQQANAQTSNVKTAVERASKQTDLPIDPKPELATFNSQIAELRRSRSGRVAERQREIESLGAKNATVGPLSRYTSKVTGKEPPAAIPTSKINPFAHFHGTRGYCVRHGRKSGQSSSEGARSTKDMFERGRNDDSQSSADACPDCVAELNIKKKELIEKGGSGTESLVGREFREMNKGGEQHAVAEHVVQIAAPAVQEQSKPIMQHREEAPTTLVHDSAEGGDHNKPDIKYVGQTAVERMVLTPKDTPNPHSDLSVSRPARHLSWNSTDVEPPVSGPRSTSSRRPSSAQSIPSSHGSGNAVSENNVAPTPDHQPRAVHFRALSSSKVHYSNHDNDIVVQRDLGEGLDAMILERGGHLERVVMNSRKGEPTAEVMARLAKELAQVSSAISATDPPSRRGREYTDGSLDGIIARRRSVPELEHLLRNAPDAQEAKTRAHLHPQADGSTEHVLARTYPSAAGSTCLDEDEVADFLLRTPSQIDRLAMRQTIEDDYRALKQHLDSAAATVDTDYRHQPTGVGYRWPTSAQCRALSFPTAGKHEPDLNLNFGSKTFPIRVEIEDDADGCKLSNSSSPGVVTDTSPSSSGLPTLPSHILRAQDMTMALQHPYVAPSPLLFTASTVPSLSPSPLPPPDTTPPASVEHGNATCSEPSNATVHPLASMPATISPPRPLESPSQVKADYQVIRQGIRMEREKNVAVQEAAAMERAVRRKRLEAVARSMSE